MSGLVERVREGVAEEIHQWLLGQPSITGRDGLALIRSVQAILPMANGLEVLREPLEKAEIQRVLGWARSCVPYESDCHSAIVKLQDDLEQEGLDAALGEPKASEHLSSERRRGLEEAAKVIDARIVELLGQEADHRLHTHWQAAAVVREHIEELRRNAKAIRSLSPSSEGGEEKTDG